MGKRKKLKQAYEEGVASGYVSALKSGLNLDPDLQIISNYLTVTVELNHSLSRNRPVFLDLFPAATEELTVAAETLKLAYQRWLQEKEEAIRG